jgi:hypothetical protein
MNIAPTYITQGRAPAHPKITSVAVDNDAKAGPYFYHKLPPDSQVMQLFKTITG